MCCFLGLQMERERESVLIVAHQAVLRALYGYFQGIPLDQVITFYDICQLKSCVVCTRTRTRPRHPIGPGYHIL